jgi:hypothetical protein
VERFEGLLKEREKIKEIPEFKDMLQDLLLRNC